MGLNNKREILPDYNKAMWWEDYTMELNVEYQQSIEEGLDIELYKGLFGEAQKLPAGKVKTALADVIFDIITNAPVKDGYKYIEPSDLEGIKAQRKQYKTCPEVDKDTLYNKIYGAWIGRIAGCFLGKAVEGIRSKEFIPFLEKSGNYPMHRYILSTDCSAENCEGMNYDIKVRGVFPDVLNYMPADDDTNYMVIGQKVIEEYGREFTSEDMMNIWLDNQPKGAYCTAERVAYINFCKGFRPPYSASYKNPYREWIGAQIRGDYFGYINPGNPEKAAEMAFRDASMSHIKNGIYGEMWASAMIAAAAVFDDIEDVIKAGLAQIPETSRLYESVYEIIDMYNSGKTSQEAFSYIHSVWNEYTGHGWCHTISNAMIVAASLLYGQKDYGKSICLAVQACFDTDCNGATVGSVLGMMLGHDAIGDEWKAHLNDTLQTNIFGYEKVKISDCAQKTLSHLLS